MSLNEEKLQEMSTQKSWRRGLNYYRSGRVKQAKIDGITVKAQVSGKSYPFYEVQIETEPPFLSYCSCPYDFGGICKHIIAAGLTWINERSSLPKAKEEKRQIKAELAELSENLVKEDFLQILTELVYENKNVMDRVLKYVKDVKGDSSIDHIFEGSRGGVDKSKYDNKVVILDTETTGLTYNDEFIEISLLLAEFDENGSLEVVDEYTGLREPDVSIHPEAQEVHNIDYETIKGEEIDDDRLLAVLNKAEFITAHNASFDRRYVVEEFPQFENKIWLCSMEGINWNRYQCNSKSLENLLYAHGIEANQIHRAALDTRALLNLLNCESELGETYFKRLLENSGIKMTEINFSEV